MNCLSVLGDKPKPTLNKSPDLNKMYVGEEVKFTCEVVSSGWTYVWYKNGTKLNNTTKTISIRLKLSDEGMYSCHVTRGEKTSTYISDPLAQHVLGRLKKTK